MLQALAVRAWCRDALDALGRAREEIDALNVYPVPDGDTGTNLYLTMESAIEELDARPSDDDLPRMLRALAHGALLGARGNSGVILSQLVRAAAEVLSAAGDDRQKDTFALALRKAADAAYAAVAHPVEGTILTVARAAADAAHAEAAKADSALAHVVRAAAAAAHEALDRTPSMLEPLRLAGVVDAGGRGLTVLLDSLVRAVTGEHPMSQPPRVAVPQPRQSTEPEQPDDGPAFEVMYLLEADDAATSTLRSALEPLGDSLLVVGGDGLWNVHVHVDDVGAAVEAGIRAGRPYRIKVTHFGEQVVRMRARGRDVGRAVVAFAPGEGLAALVRQCGALVVLGGPGNRPATRDVLEAIQAAHAPEVVVLPNDADTVPVAEAAAEYARAGGLRVAVIPTRASVQVLAALAVHDAGRRYEDDVVSMTAAARATRTGSVTTAVREALTSVGVCRPGDVLGLIEGDVVSIGDDVEASGEGVLDRMLMSGGELVTLLLGVEAATDLADRLERHLAQTHPEVEVLVHAGGQQHYPLLVGVE
ncbi:MAG TPA: DAK2 domain-containing protein [Actinomycetes bacterium]